MSTLSTARREKHVRFYIASGVITVFGVPAQYGLLELCVRCLAEFVELRTQSSAPDTELKRTILLRLSIMNTLTTTTSTTTTTTTTATTKNYYYYYYYYYYSCLPILHNST